MLKYIAFARSEFVAVKFAWRTIFLSFLSLIERFMGPTWGPSGAGRTQVGPMFAPWILLSGNCSITSMRGPAAFVNTWRFPCTSITHTTFAFSDCHLPNWYIDTYLMEKWYVTMIHANNVHLTGPLCGESTHLPDGTKPVPDPMLSYHQQISPDIISLA